MKDTRTLQGQVVSDKMDKSLVVLIKRRKKHPIGKYITLHSKIHVHDEKNEAKSGDIVLIGESRPFSKTKSWSLLKVIEKNIVQE
ncbi:MAG: 30S ribosomal protein S17 [Legionellales bacterium]|nr:30S ribosomal protein S17 [Legionellales bacterium]OUX64318.1 MAG: 30S ribosomal protein S17 [Gammaproteobacteria bacterium TMED281]|tara:strand:- start:255 stop:509 length:255 start_codon:yes stop_codon:yes gene_type:complete